MNIACADETVVPAVRAVLHQYHVSHVSQQGPNFGSPMIWVMVANITLNEDTERAMRRDIAQIAGAVIH